MNYCGTFLLSLYLHACFTYHWGLISVVKICDRPKDQTEQNVLIIHKRIFTITYQLFIKAFSVSYFMLT